MHMSQKRKQMNYMELLLGIKGTEFLLNTAESPPSLYNGICTFYSQDACAFKKEKGKTKRYHENHLELGLQVVSLHLWMWFGFVFSLPLSRRWKNPHLAWQLGLQRPILSQAISVHHYTA